MTSLRAHLLAGQVIPAHPLALTAQRRLDHRRQRALTRYYVDAGAGGMAVGVHTTQFAIRQHGMLHDVLSLGAESAHEWLARSPRGFTLIAGAVGGRDQAVREATLARDLGYDAVLLSLAGHDGATHEQLLAHCRAVGEVLPLIGFYLQPAVGGRRLDYRFWRDFAELPDVVAIKIAPFNRYQTLDVVRAVVDAGRDDVALYTGNDDNIVADLLTPFTLARGEQRVTRHIVGGLLGQWAVWTHRAVAMLAELARLRTRSATSVDPSAGGNADAYRRWLAHGVALTDANGALFDVTHQFAGCIPGIHEVLRRQRLLDGTWCLDPAEALSPGQSAELDRVATAYPELHDDDFVAEHRDRWMA
ncbi:MAG: dihydrodipicolinate synthase family protein [Gemmatimonadaceae bacterium]|nr:dihydrodipicolinate synthase family protein [Gemmatimonadaceae bacterium]